MGEALRWLCLALLQLSKVDSNCSFLASTGWKTVDNQISTLEEVRGSQLSDCQTACARRNGCVGFTFVSSIGRCDLKTEDQAVFLDNTNDDSIISASLKPDPIFLIQPGSGWKTADDKIISLGQVRGSQLTDCQAACLAEPGCVGFTFISSRDRCDLKTRDQAVFLDDIYDDSIISANLTQLQSCTPEQVPVPNDVIADQKKPLSETNSNIEECTRDYSETGGVHFAIAGVEEEIKAPWLAALGISRENFQFSVTCSGSILTKKVILSAAHCFFVSERLKPTHVIVGANNLESVFVELRDIFDVKIHPDYDSVKKAYYFDISLITMDIELKFDSRKSPICLPITPFLHPGNGRGISVQGWGKTERGRGKEVSQVNVNVRTMLECDSKIKIFGESEESGQSKIDRWIPQLTTNVLFCADANLNQKTGVCFGDSGGPAIVRDFVDGSNRNILVGTVTGNLNSCGGGVPDIYNFIGNEKILNWIQSTLRT